VNEAPYPESGISEEMRKQLFAFIDEIITPNPHDELLRRLRALRNSLTLEVPMPLYDITTLDKAIQALEAHS
jgi:hypothetical protein